MMSCWFPNKVSHLPGAGSDPSICWILTLSWGPLLCKQTVSANWFRNKIVCLISMLRVEARVVYPSQLANRQAFFLFRDSNVKKMRLHIETHDIRCLIQSFAGFSSIQWSASVYVVMEAPANVNARCPHHLNFRSRKLTHGLFRICVHIRESTMVYRQVISCWIFHQWNYPPLARNDCIVHKT